MLKILMLRFIILSFIFLNCNCSDSNLKKLTDIKQAISNSDVNGLKEILENDKEQKIVNSYVKIHNLGMPLLSFAICNHADMKIIQLLIDHKADLRLLDEIGRSPLRVAFDSHHFKFCELLLKLGADVNEKDGSGRTFLHLAVQGMPEEVAIEMVTLLLKFGAVSLQDNKNNYPLDYVSHGSKLPLLFSQLGQNQSSCIIL